jgi:hypothetical protein
VASEARRRHVDGKVPPAIADVLARAKAAEHLAQGERAPALPAAARNPASLSQAGRASRHSRQERRWLLSGGWKSGPPFRASNGGTRAVVPLERKAPPALPRAPDGASSLGGGP